ncbi:MAG: hypothetical protein ACE5DX_04230 [Candidatus Dojkabacteria bacterium]
MNIEPQEKPRPSYLLTVIAVVVAVVVTAALVAVILNQKDQPEPSTSSTQPTPTEGDLTTPTVTPTLETVDLPITNKIQEMKTVVVTALDKLLDQDSFEMSTNFSDGDEYSITYRAEIDQKNKIENYILSQEGMSTVYGCTNDCGSVMFKDGKVTRIKGSGGTVSDEGGNEEDVLDSLDDALPRVSDLSTLLRDNLNFSKAPDYDVFGSSERSVVYDTEVVRYTFMFEPKGVAQDPYRIVAEVDTHGFLRFIKMKNVFASPEVYFNYLGEEFNF